MTTPTQPPPPTVLATGAYLKNCAGLSLDGRWWPSAEHGDLNSAEACGALEASLQRLVDQASAAGRPVRAVAHDLHPDFHSTRLALAWATRLGVPAIGVQHHLAHIAVTLAEQDVTGRVIGIALDGVGLGSDGGAWGGELLQVCGAQWQRVGHLLPLALPGGDRAATEPWRMAAAALHAMGRANEITPRFAPVVGRALTTGLQQMLDRRLNCPPSSSTGRWFDAAAAALGLCVAHQHEAQAAVALEALAASARLAQVGVHVPAQPRVQSPAQVQAMAAQPRTGAAGVIDLRPVLAEVLRLGDAGLRADAALCFHRGLAGALAQAAASAARADGTTTVVLGGGCFFNQLLSQHLQAGLQARGLQVLRPAEKSCGDAGLARGQAWVAQQQMHASERCGAAANTKEKTCA